MNSKKFNHFKQIKKIYRKENLIFDRTKYIRLDKNERVITYGKKSVKLTERELDIILYLYGKKDGAKKQEIMKDIWSHGEEIDSHTYETHLYRLRQKIQKKLNDKKFITIKNGKYFISS